MIDTVFKFHIAAVVSTNTFICCVQVREFVNLIIRDAFDGDVVFVLFINLVCQYFSLGSRSEERRVGKEC